MVEIVTPLEGASVPQSDERVCDNARGCVRPLQVLVAEVKRVLRARGAASRRRGARAAAGEEHADPPSEPVQGGASGSGASSCAAGGASAAVAGAGAGAAAH